MNTKKSTLQLELLKQLLEGKKISLKEFSEINDISIRTTQRYIKEIQEIFEDNILKENEQFSFISNLFLEKNILTFNKKELEIFVDLSHIFNFDFINRFENLKFDFIKKIEKNYSKVYLMKQNPIENIFLKKEMFFDIKDAIKNRRYSNIEYESDRKFYFENSKILRIIFAEGNFYIVVLTNEEINNGLKFLRLNFIKSIKLLANSFQKDYEAEDFLKKFQTLFSQYKVPNYKVEIEVDKSIKRFFLQKSFLSSQKIVKDEDNLILSFDITNDMEILPLVKKWLPNIKILSPLSTKMKLENELKEYLKS